MVVVAPVPESPELVEEPPSEPELPPELDPSVAVLPPPLESGPPPLVPPSDPEAVVPEDALLHGRWLVLRRGKKTVAGVELVR